MPSVPTYHNMFRALRHRNYKLFYAGQFASLIGTWITSVATSWLVYRLTHSSFLLGAVGFASQFPTSIVSLWAGVRVDRVDRQKVLLATQTISMIQSFVLALLTLSGRITMTHLFILSAIQGLTNAFDLPARQSFVAEMIEDRRDLPNAIALNSAMFNGARLLGPAIGGLLITMSNEGVCFLVDGFSYLAVIASLRAIRITKHRTPQTGARNDWKEFSAGFAYVRGFKPVSQMLLLIATMSLFGMNYLTLLPVFATETFKGGAGILGTLMAASGFGALVGAFGLAMRKSVIGMGKLIAAAGMLQGIAICCFAFSNNFWLSMFLLFVAGGSMITMAAACNTLIQSLVEDSMRGRVMSFYTLAFFGAMPIGSLTAGTLSVHIGTPLTVAFGGAVSFAGACYFASQLSEMRRIARPVLIERGIVQLEEI